MAARTTILRLVDADKSRKALDKIVECAMRLTQAETGFVVARRSDKNWHVESSERPGMKMPEDIRYLRGLVELIRADGKTLVETCPEDEPGLCKSMVIAGLEGVAAAIVLLEWKRPTDFSESDARILESVAPLASLTLSLITKVSELESDLERERAHVSHACRLIVGESEPILDLVKKVATVARTDAPVLITGESGTGKEVVARSIHQASPRKDEPFVAFNMASLSEHMAEAELFGHVAKAFTGADRAHVGLFAQAHRGTFFLDEIGDMPLLLQAKILRAIEQREVRRLGSEKAEKFDARILAATNRDLEAKVAAGTFRQDLYYRLRVVELRTPPLRERRGDVYRLAQFFVKEWSRKLEREAPVLSREALEALEAHKWPGNVRELQNCIQRAVVWSKDTIRLADLDLPAPRSRRKENVTDEEILAALELHGNNKALVAKILGVARRTVYRAIERLERKKKKKKT